MAKLQAVNMGRTEDDVVDGPTIKVRVKEDCEVYYEHERKRAGDVFTLKPRMVNQYDIKFQEVKRDKKTGEVLKRLLTAEQQFSAMAMERIEDEADETVSTAQDAINRQSEDIKRARQAGGKR